MTNNPDIRALITYLEGTMSNLRAVEIKLEAAIRSAKGLEPLGDKQQAAGSESGE